MKRELSIFDVVALVIRSKKIFLYTGIASILISGIYAFVLPVYYKSTCILYPFNPEAYDPRNVNKATNPWGSSMDGDRIMALAESREVQDLIINKYHMMDRYDIEPTDKLADYKVREEFIGNLIVQENDLSAIEISFYDLNPDTAAFIVNDIVAKVDSLNKKPLVDISKKIFESYEKLIQDKYEGIDSIQKIIEKIDFKNNFTRSEIISTELLNTILELKIAHKSLELIEQDFSTLNIIERAEPVAKKAKPKRLLVILGTLSVVMIVTFLVVLLKEFARMALTKDQKNLTEPNTTA